MEYFVEILYKPGILIRCGKILLKPDTLVLVIYEINDKMYYFRQ